MAPFITTLKVLVGRQVGRGEVVQRLEDQILLDARVGKLRVAERAQRGDATYPGLHNT